MGLLKRAKGIKLQRGLNIIIAVLALSMVAYHLIAVFLSPLPPVVHGHTHLTFVLLLIFLPALQQAVQKGKRLASLMVSILLLLTLIGVVYVYLFSENLELKMGMLSTTDVVIGSILCILVFEACRRAQGRGLPIVGLIFVAYVFLGQYLPPPFYHPPIPFLRIIFFFGMSVQTGIYGSLIYISANIIFLFILFGVMLEITKARDFFNLVGLLVGRKLPGGAAQTSLISSGLVGSITGSPTANVIITGSVTIPLMKRMGFKAAFAAAVEGAASTGGMFLPPVMGAVAFMMMSLTGLPYWTICLSAFIPAILYYLGIGFSIHFYSSREKIPPTEEKLDLRLLLRRAPLFIIPFALISILLALQYPPMYAAGWALVVGLVLGFISKETRPPLAVLVDALTRGAKTAASIATMLILCNLSIISVMSVTSVGPTLGSVIHAWGGGFLPAILVLTMFVSLLLGCVNPIAGSYLIVALVVTPLLLDMGLTIIQAHFFALYFGTLAFLTPPIAPTIIVSSAMAQAPFLRSVWHGLRLVASGFLLPFIFAYEPALLGQFTSGPLVGILSILVTILVMVSTSITLYNHYLTRLSWPEIALAAASALSFLAYVFTQGNMFLIIGATCFILLTLWQLKKWKTVRDLEGSPISSHTINRQGTWDT